jgi:hypothetical protein
VRLWTLHPRYLDPQGLVALWREALLARAVLRDETRGYRQHPQLERFRAHASPRRAIDAYLAAVHDEATARGHAFDRSRIGALRKLTPITATDGQLQYEWTHLLRKLSVRNPAWCERWRDVDAPECHPLFAAVPGAVAAWERVPATGDSAPQDRSATAIPSGIASTG